MSRLLYTIVFIFISVLEAMSQKDCVLRKEADSIKVYTCAAEESKFKTITSTFTINASLPRLVAFILDVENYVNWQYNTIEANVLKKLNDHELIYYTQIAAPWPVSNRDMVTVLNITQDPVTKVVTIATKSDPYYIPEREDIVRVPMSRASWTVVPVTPTRLEVKYIIRIDPGGAVPAWMINMVAAQAPYDSFRNLKNQIGEYPRKKIEVPFILE